MVGPAVPLEGGTASKAREFSSSKPSTTTMKLFLTPTLLAALTAAPFTLLAHSDTQPAEGGATVTTVTTAIPSQDETSEFGAPLIVNGVRISDMEIKRYLCYGPGRIAVESAKIKILVDQERKIRAEAGEDLAQFTLAEETFERARRREIGEFQVRYPTLDLATEISRAYKSVQWYEHQLRQTLEFDAMFFPEDPAQWPPVTVEAVHAGVAAGQQPGAQPIDLVADAKENYDLRVEYAKTNGTELAPEDDMFMGLMRDYVIEALNQMVVMETQQNGLPPEILVRGTGNGIVSEVVTQEVYDSVKHFLSEKDVSDAKRFLALIRATEDKLLADEALMSEDDYKAVVAKLANELSSSMFNMDFLAMQAHQFPSLESYQRHLRALESYRTTVEPDLYQDENGGISPVLQQHLSIANRVMGLGKVDAEVLLVSAFDSLKFTWKEDGWTWAEAQSAKLKQQVDDHIDKLIAFDEQRTAAAASGENITTEEPLSFEEYWAELLDLHSDFWDPPMPTAGKMPSMVGMKLKGRFGPNTRNDLERDIGESPFVHMLTGNSVTDKIFFNMEVGTVAGPFIGPQGYYVVYLRSRSAPTNPLRTSEPKHMQLLREDYVRRNFVSFANECLAKAEVSGL